MIKTKLVAILGCCLAMLAVGCAGDGGKRDAAVDGAVDAARDAAHDAAADTAVDAGLLPYPVLDPQGTYGGKTYAEWLGAWWKHYMELPDVTDIVHDTTGAYCAVGQSLAPGDGGTGADAFFLGNWVSGKVTLSCTIPLGEMIFLPLFTGGCDNASVPMWTLTDEQLKAFLASFLASVTGLSLEIDGKSYGSKLADFAAYFIEPTEYSYTMPDTPTNYCNSLPEIGCTGFSGFVPNSFGGGYAVLLAPLAAGSHTIHVVAVAGATTFDETWNLTIGDASTLGAIDGGPSVDAALPVSSCSGPASGALIDDMSGPNISLAPPSCGSPGGWSAFTTPPGVLTSPAGDPAVLSNCGSLCQPLYSPLPAVFPGTTTGLDAGAIDAATSDGGTAIPQAMCIAGQTLPKQYDRSGMTLTFAYSGTGGSGTGPVKIYTPSYGFTTDPPPALIDASQYSGIEFWLWASPDTAAAMSAGFVVELVDKNQLPGAGVCKPNHTSGPKPCSGASAGIAFSTAAGSQGAGSLLAVDGSELTSLAPGWQLVHAPWGNFIANAYYGGGNEKRVDPTTLAFAQFWIQQDGANGIAIPFDFCVYGLRFYK